ncbi:MAG: hypothetical protein LJE93_16890 [Acidobacteria bacterium]|jgi:hypothetical protein|nr:hypothetical protein [Acidobacteriota bacterium]
MRIFATAIFLTTMIPTATSGQDLREVSVYDGHATLEIPYDWNEIPEEMLEFYSLRAAESSGGRTAEIYQHGFRPGDPEMDFALPQILIQIRESGRLNYRRFANPPSSEELLASGERVLSEHTGPMVRGIELGSAVFDREKYALHLSNTLDLKFEGETSVESVAFLTERGLFTVHFYADASQTARTDPLFRRISESIRFDEELAYRPHLTDLWPPSPSTVFFLLAALVAAVALAYHFTRPRHQPS